MTNAQVQRKLDQMVKLTNELHQEAQKRYGKAGQLFYEPESGFFLMDGDNGGSIADRQAHIRFRSRGHAHMGAGGW